MTSNVRDNPNNSFSSLSYQILLVFGWWYFACYIIGEVALLLFKKYYYVYPTGNFFSELTLLILLFSIEAIRNFLARKGNLTERILSIVLSLLLTVPVACGATYFLYWQTYVLMIDLIISIILLIFFGLQTLFAGFTLVTFNR